MHLPQIFVQPIPRDPVTHVRRQAGLPTYRFSMDNATPHLPSRIAPVVMRIGSRNTVTRSRGIHTRFPFHLCRALPPQAHSVLFCYALMITSLFNCRNHEHFVRNIELILFREYPVSKVLIYIHFIKAYLSQNLLIPQWSVQKTNGKHMINLMALIL